MEQKLNCIGNRIGMNSRPKPNHPWFRAKHGSAQFKDPEGYVRPIGQFATLEDMSLPCPHDICDGSGVVIDDETARVCLCKTDRELDESY